MKRQEIRDSIIEILSNIAPDENFDDLKDDVSFREQLSMDSMDMLDIVLELRRKYKLQIPESDYPHLASMNTTLDYLDPLLQDR